jgi:ABC-type multidrug transport system permease subunit
MLRFHVGYVDHLRVTKCANVGEIGSLLGGVVMIFIIWDFGAIPVKMWNVQHIVHVFE